VAEEETNKATNNCVCGGRGGGNVCVGVGGGGGGWVVCVRNLKIVCVRNLKIVFGLWYN